MRAETTIPQVRGLDLDTHTRCRHYHSEKDVIAIKMKCCGAYYACIECHASLAAHPNKLWPRSEWETPAVLCGVCKTELSIHEYLNSDNRCPNCQAAFNPGCRNHYHLYFEQAWRLRVSSRRSQGSELSGTESTNLSS